MKTKVTHAMGPMKTESELGESYSGKEVDRCLYVFPNTSTPMPHQSDPYLAYEIAPALGK